MRSHLTINVNGELGAHRCEVRTSSGSGPGSCPARTPVNPPLSGGVVSGSNAGKSTSFWRERISRGNVAFIDPLGHLWRVCSSLSTPITGYCCGERDTPSSSQRLPRGSMKATARTFRLSMDSPSMCRRKCRSYKSFERAARTGRRRTCWVSAPFCITQTPTQTIRLSGRVLQ